MAQFVFLRIIQGRFSVPAFSIRVSQCGLEPGKPPKLRRAAREVGSSPCPCPPEYRGAGAQDTAAAARRCAGARLKVKLSVAPLVAVRGCAVVDTLRRTEDWQLVLGRRNMQSHTT